MRKSVVLPAPLGPITPTIPAGGSEKERSSISSLSPKALRRWSASITRSPRRGPAGMWICTCVELDLLVLGQQRLVAGEARLRLLAPALRVLAHPLELRGDRAAARAVLALLMREALLLLLEPGGVVALEGDAAAAVELEDPAGDVVEEVAIVGDGDDRALVLLQVTLEPGHGLRVQVVGGLVEQQQVGRAQQQAAEGHPAALATGERGHVGVARAAGAARPSPSPASCRGSRRRPRRSDPGGGRTRPPSRPSSWRPAR